VQQTATEKGDRSPILFSRWVHPNNKNTQSEYQLLSGGQTLNFWKIDGSRLSSKQGRFGRSFKQVPITCVANLNGTNGYTVVAGTMTGALVTFDEREIVSMSEEAHIGPVLCLAEGNNEGDCSFLVSGGKDKMVKIWSNSLQLISMLAIGPSLSIRDGTIASLDVKPTERGELVVLVGTCGGEIIEIKGSASKKDGGMDLTGADSRVLINSHSGGELWGLATHPIDADIFVTVGEDGILRIWSLSSKTMLLSLFLGWPARCVTFNPSGGVLAVGFKESVKGGVNKGGKKHGKSKKRAGKEEKEGKEEVEMGRGGRGDKDGNSQRGDNEKGKKERESKHSGAVHLYSFTMSNNNNNNKNDGNNNNNKVQIHIEKISVGCSSLATISDIKFSYNGRNLLVSSHDKKLYCYPVPEVTLLRVAGGLEWDSFLSDARFIFNKHSSAVLHTDCSVDGKYLQTDSQSGELLFIDLERGRQETSATKMAEYNR
jgi:WD40 repeat protein